MWYNYSRENDRPKNRKEGKMKRIFGMIMVLMLVIGSTQMVYANEKSGAQELFDNGFIFGADGDLMINKMLTRAEASALLAEMYGKKGEAAKYKYNQTFSDVKASDWYANFAGYAKLNGWISGYPNGDFGPLDPVSSQQWAAMLMNVLGYPYRYETAEEDIQALGIQVSGVVNSKLTRGEAFEAMWRAVNTPRAGQSIILGEELGKLVTPVVVPTNPYVKEAKASGLKQIILTSNLPLDSALASQAKNYRVESAYVHDLEVVDAQYVASNLTVTLTLNKPVPQQSEVKLTLQNIKTPEGVIWVNDLFPTVDMTDLAPPTILSATNIGNRAIKVVFSEPVRSLQEANNMTGDFTPALPVTDFKFNAGVLIPKSITLANHNREAIIEFYVDLTGTVKLETNASVRDYAGFAVFNTSLNIPTVKDTTPPKVIGYKDASATGVTLIWSEDIVIFNGNASNYYHTSSPNMVDGAITSKAVSGNHLRLDFTKNFLASGKVPVIVSIGVISDYSGNKNGYEIIQVELPIDNIPPTVVSGVVPETEKKVKLTFSEGVYNKNGEVQARSNYKLFDAQNIDRTALISTLVYNVASQALEITFTENLMGVYRLEIGEIKDYSGNALQLKSYVFEMKDLTPPNSNLWTARVYNSKTSNQMVKIRFDEPMAIEGKYNINDLEKYTINGKALTALDKNLLRLVVTDNNTSLEIYYPGAIVKGGVDFIADANKTKSAADDVVIARVADANNNFITDFSVIVDLEEKGVLAIEQAVQVASDEIELMISDALTVVNLSDFKVESTGKLYGINSYNISYTDSRKTKLTLKLKENIVGNSNLVTVKAIGSGSSNIYGETLDLAATALVLQDKVAPTLAQTNFDGTLLPHVAYTRSTGVITLKFNEDIDPRTVYLLTFEVSNYGIDSIVAVGNEVRITISSADRNRVSVYDTLTQKFELRDLSGNGLTGLQLQIQKIY